MMTVVYILSFIVGMLISWWLWLKWEEHNEKKRARAWWRRQAQSIIRPRLNRTPVEELRTVQSFKDLESLTVREHFIDEGSKVVVLDTFDLYELRDGVWRNIANAWWRRQAQSIIRRNIANVKGKTNES